jgi:hypothetical protein
MNTPNSLRRTALQRAGYDVYRFAGTELFLGMKKVAEEIFTTALMYRFGGGREAWMSYRQSWCKRRCALASARLVTLQGIVSVIVAQ